MKQCVTLIPGDGVGPEVTAAARRVIDETGVGIQWEVCEAGEKAFRKGLSSGVPQETLEGIERNKVALKGPLATPVGYGEKSANVTLRKVFDTYANLRPVRNLKGIRSPYADRKIDFVIVRENIEDLYAGIEHHLTADVAQALKIISRPGCERIVGFAFDYAVACGRRAVQCATKANILKLTEGMFKQVFEETARAYPQIDASHLIVDNCAHQMVRSPEKFDVVVMSNMNGDILSDMASGLVGGLGLAPAANIGQDVALFEAVHGSAPRHGGQNTINPTAMILAGAMLLRHLGAHKEAVLVEQAIEAAFLKGLHTADIPGSSPLSTTAFTDAILREMEGIASSGTVDTACPSLGASSFVPSSLPAPQFLEQISPVPSCASVGVDIFLSFQEDVSSLVTAIEGLLQNTPFQLLFVDNRGFVLYPPPFRSVACTTSWRVRLKRREECSAQEAEAALYPLLERLSPVAPWSQVTRLLVDEQGRELFTKAQAE